MFKRGLAGCLVLSIASVANAGALIEFFPEEGTGPLAPGETVTLKVWLTQDLGGMDRGLRHFQLDFSDSDPALVFADEFTYDYSDVITGNSAYVEFPEVSPESPVASTSFLSLGPTDPLNLGMLVMGEKGTRFMGSIDVTLPEVLGTYEVDILNANESDVDFGAQLVFGFGGEGDPVTTWRAYTGRAGELRGNYFAFVDDGQGGFGSIPEPASLALMALAAVVLVRRRRPAQ